MCKFKLEELEDPARLREGDVLIFNSGYKTLVTYSEKGVTKTLGTSNLGFSVVESRWEDYEPGVAGWKPNKSKLVLISDEEHREYAKFMKDNEFGR